MQIVRVKFLHPSCMPRDTGDIETVHAQPDLGMATNAIGVEEVAPGGIDDAALPSGPWTERNFGWFPPIDGYPKGNDPDGISGAIHQYQPAVAVTTHSDQQTVAIVRHVWRLRSQANRGAAGRSLVHGPN